MKTYIPFVFLSFSLMQTVVEPLFIEQKVSKLPNANEISVSL